MDTVLSIFGSLFNDSSTMVMALLVFLAAGTLAFSLMVAVRVRGAVKKRTSRIMNDEERNTHGRSLQNSSAKAVTKASRIHHEALLGGQRREHEGVAQASGASRASTIRAELPTSSSDGLLWRFVWPLLCSYFFRL